MANTVQTFSSQPTTLQTTLLFPPKTVLTVKMNPSNRNRQQPNNNLYNTFFKILIGEKITGVDANLNAALKL